MSLVVRYSNCTLIMNYLSKIKDSNNYYYIRRIPKDVQFLYEGKKDMRIHQSLKTSNIQEATKRANMLTRRLEAEWEQARTGVVALTTLDAAKGLLSKYGLPFSKAPSSHTEQFYQMIENIEDELSFEDRLASFDAYQSGNHELIQSVREDSLASEQLLALDIANGRFQWTASLMLEEFLKLKGWDNSRKHINDFRPAFRELIELLGDRAPKDYSRIEVVQLIQYLKEDKQHKTSTIRKRLGCIRSVFNYVARIHDLRDEKGHSFTDFEIEGLRQDAQDRPDFTQEQLQGLRARVAENLSDEISGLIAVMMETGLRVSEVCGLRSTDLHDLQGDAPFLSLHKDPMRRLKTKSSQRFVPLVGEALKFAQGNSNSWLFPKYVDENTGVLKNDNASAAVNKRLKAWLGPDSPTAHSFRHTIATRLRDVECPKAIIEELGGWTTSISEHYGSPSDIKRKHKYLIASLDWKDSGWKPPLR